MAPREAKFAGTRLSFTPLRLEPDTPAAEDSQEGARAPSQGSPPGRWAPGRRPEPGSAPGLPCSLRHPGFPPPAAAGVPVGTGEPREEGCGPGNTTSTAGTASPPRLSSRHPPESACPSVRPPGSSQDLRPRTRTLSSRPAARSAPAPTPPPGQSALREGGWGRPPANDRGCSRSWGIGRGPASRGPDRGGGPSVGETSRGTDAQTSAHCHLRRQRPFNQCPRRCQAPPGQPSHISEQNRHQSPPWQPSPGPELTCHPAPRLPQAGSFPSGLGPNATSSEKPTLTTAGRATLTPTPFPFLSLSAGIFLFMDLSVRPPGPARWTRGKEALSDVLSRRARCLARSVGWHDPRPRSTPLGAAH